MFKRLLSVGLLAVVLPLVGGCPCCGTASCCTESAKTVESDPPFIGPIMARELSDQSPTGSMRDTVAPPDAEE